MKETENIWKYKVGNNANIANSNQTICINSLVVARQNVPITFIHTETALS